MNMELDGLLPKCNLDGSANVISLDKLYVSHETTLTAEEVSRIKVESLNASHDEILVVKNKDTGKVEKIFLPNVDRTPATEAGWVEPMDVSLDPMNPTHLDNARGYHTRHVLYSVLLGKGSEPFPEATPNTRFELHLTTQYAADTKLSNVDLTFSLAIDSSGTEVYSHPRPVGYTELDTPEGKIINASLQFKIKDSGESRIITYGYGGEALDLPGFIPNDLNTYRPVMIYQAIGDENAVNFWIGASKECPVLNGCT
jgi:hypothetical protein